MCRLRRADRTGPLPCRASRSLRVCARRARGPDRLRQEGIRCARRRSRIPRGGEAALGGFASPSGAKPSLWTPTFRRSPVGPRGAGSRGVAIRSYPCRRRHLRRLSRRDDHRQSPRAPRRPPAAEPHRGGPGQGSEKGETRASSRGVARAGGRLRPYPRRPEKLRELRERYEKRERKLGRHMRRSRA